MASNYNARFRPAEVLIYNDKAHLIRKRETLDDLVEAYQGHYPRIKFSPSLSMVSYGEGTHETWITTTEKCLSDLRSTLPQTDLQNMIDELLGVISKFRFLLTLDK
jgi:hypothetical protein